MGYQRGSRKLSTYSEDFSRIQLLREDIRLVLNSELEQGSERWRGIKLETMVCSKLAQAELITVLLSATSVNFRTTHSRQSTVVDEI
jgi:hypothetical protein